MRSRFERRLVASLGSDSFLPSLRHISPNTYSIKGLKLDVIERGHIHHGALEQDRGGLTRHLRDCVPFHSSLAKKPEYEPAITDH